MITLLLTLAITQSAMASPAACVEQVTNEFYGVKGCEVMHYMTADLTDPLWVTRGRCVDSLDTVVIVVPNDLVAILTVDNAAKMFALHSNLYPSEVSQAFDKLNRIDFDCVDEHTSVAIIKNR
jgi:hypothetical protein